MTKDALMEEEGVCVLMMNRHAMKYGQLMNMHKVQMANVQLFQLCFAPTGKTRPRTQPSGLTALLRLRASIRSEVLAWNVKMRF